MSSESRSLPYQPSLDAVRGIAILLVLGLHYGLFGFGWIGVQLFFVLSGYLITQILINERGKTLKDYAKCFYIRRALRIFPIYYVFISAALVCYFVLGYPSVMAKYWPYLYSYTFNLAYPFIAVDLSGAGPAIAAGASFDPFLEIWQQDPMSHMWSLSIEEQFYLIWPWVVYALALPKLRSLLVALIIGAPLLRASIGELGPLAGMDPIFAKTFVYFLPPCQADAFASGALLAFLPQLSLKQCRCWFFGSLALLLFAGYLNHRALTAGGLGDEAFAFGYPLYMVKNYQYIWGYSLLNLCGAGLIAYFRAMPAPKPTLGWKALVRMGKVSYGMYVLHLLALIPFRQWIFVPGLSLPEFVFHYLSYVVVIWGLAEISFRLIERPFLNLKARFS